MRMVSEVHIEIFLSLLCHMTFYMLHLKYVESLVLRSSTDLSLSSIGRGEGLLVALIMDSPVKLRK
jgi:hypothetical protein